MTHRIAPWGSLRQAQRAGSPATSFARIAVRSFSKSTSAPTSRSSHSAVSHLWCEQLSCGAGEWKVCYEGAKLALTQRMRGEADRGGLVRLAPHARVAAIRLGVDSGIGAPRESRSRPLSRRPSPRPQTLGHCTVLAELLSSARNHELWLRAACLLGLASRSSVAPEQTRKM